MANKQPNEFSEFGASEFSEFGKDGISEFSSQESAVTEFDSERKRPTEFDDSPNSNPDAVISRSQQVTSETVSVIVTARNNGPFLEACLHSILSQTHAADEVIYCDDGSTDDSLKIAERFAVHGVRSIALSHCGVVAARNHAFSESSGDRLLFVDGDNLLPPDFLEKSMAALDGEDGATFAYAGKQYFGKRNEIWQPPVWDRRALWIDNYVDTSALIRREIFEAAGRWKASGAKTMWDWDLFLRASRFGPGRRSGALLHYRDHDGNWSKHVRGERRQLRATIRRAAAHMTVCTIYSGRLASQCPDWLDALVKGLHPVEREKPGLFILDDSPDGFWKAGAGAIEKHADFFSSIRVARVHDGGLWSERRPDRRETARFLSMVYNRFLSETTHSDVLWFVEDDIFVPPGAARQLLTRLFEGDRPRAAVTGLYRSRFENWLRCRSYPGRSCHSYHRSTRSAGTLRHFGYRLPDGAEIPRSRSLRPILDRAIHWTPRARSRLAFHLEPARIRNPGSRRSRRPLPPLHERKRMGLAPETSALAFSNDWVLRKLG